MMKQKQVLCLTFIFITLFYLTTRWYIFQGFNGTDDLHYAMLASRMVNHTFSAFVQNDIFSGRILLIGIQSVIYRIGGIGILTTQVGTHIAAIWCCYLTVFKIIRPKTHLEVLLVCSLFYFNPVLLNGTLGIMPDAYIMLSGMYIISLAKGLLTEKTGRHMLIKSFAVGALIGLSLLIKEIAIVFLFFFIIGILVYKPRQSIYKITMLMMGFLVVVSAIGWYYYLHTGNFFFKVDQINKSDYRNTISQETGLKDLFFRLTYGPWKIFIMQGFYPLVLASLILILRGFSNGCRFIKSNYYTFSFVVLLLLTLYLPFSLQEFKPLYIQARHFLFLLPFAVVICSEYLYSYFEQGQKSRVLPVLLLGIVMICIFSTGNKWQWMIYGLITGLVFTAPYLRLNFKMTVLLTCLILWLSILENVFFKNYPWFKEMQVLNKEISGNCFYFTDNDNMMHWELLYQFDTNNYYYNLEKNPFPSFSVYNSSLHPEVFNPGWLIVNHINHQPPARFQNILNALKKTPVPGKYIEHKWLEAFYIDNLATLRNLMVNIE